MSEVSLEVEVGNITYEHPVTNAAGIIKTLQDVRKHSLSNLAGILVGSVTKEFRLGNQGETLREGDGFWLNALGMPNAGMDVYTGSLISEMSKITNSKGKPLGVSVAGFTPEEYMELTYRAVDTGADYVEVNLGCPNAYEGAKQHRIASFYPEIVDAILDLITIDVGSDINLQLKVSPYSNPENLKEIAEVIKRYKVVKAIVACNTFPNAVELDKNGKPLLTQVFGGYSGKGFKPIAVGQVMQWTKALEGSGVKLIGAGGIVGPHSAIEHLNAGASRVQLGSKLLNLKRLNLVDDIIEAIYDRAEKLNGQVL